MSDAYVSDAQFWSRRLVEAERARSGAKLNDAMERVAERNGLDYYVLWALRYRPAFEPVVSAYMRLRDAYERECARQEARLEHELLLAREAGLDETNSAYVAAAAALLRAMEKKPEARP